MIDTLDEKKHDICKFSHSHSGARQQISSSSLCPSHSAGHRLLGAQQRSWQQKWGPRKAAEQHGCEGLPQARENTAHREQNQKMCTVARSTGAKPPSPCRCHPTLKACRLSQKPLLLYSRPNRLLLDITPSTYPHCPSLFQQAMDLNLRHHLRRPKSTEHNTARTGRGEKHGGKVSCTIKKN